MVALAKRVRKLEKKVADQSHSGRLGEEIFYHPSLEELNQALKILLDSGAVITKS